MIIYNQENQPCQDEWDKQQEKKVHVKVSKVVIQQGESICEDKQEDQSI